MKNEQETPPPVLNKFNIDYESENGFNYNLTLYLQNSLIHFSLFSTNLPSTFYQKEFSFDDLKNIKYYSAFFENINDIYCDICDLIKEKHLVMMEKEKSILLIINLPMKKRDLTISAFPNKDALISAITSVIKDSILYILVISLIDTFSIFFI